MPSVLDNKNHPMVLTVMIIDDQGTERKILETIIKTVGDNINITSFDNAFSALDSARDNPPDLILTDYRMPEMNGVDFIKTIREIPGCIDIPIIVVTIVNEKAVLYDALDAGATDFLIKPVDHYQCKVRCRNLLTLRKQQLIIKHRAFSLQQKISETIDEVKIREKEILHRLARAGEFKDINISLNQKRVGTITRSIGEYIGLDAERCEILETASSIHDIGKIGIPDHILCKAGSLSPEEKKIMQRHTQIGYEILKDSPSPYLQMGAIIALNHHEQFDGNGYPDGLSSQQIPLEARIVAVADVFDALTSVRAYKKAWSIEKSLQYIKDVRGNQLDPECVDALVENIDTIVASTDLKNPDIVNGHE
ncbi:MAG: response regulator [Thiotrichales bacterium]|nr:response regulator [Thiotrichales bacterium]